MAAPTPPSTTGGPPKVHASTSLPSVLSFTSVGEPHLLISLTLVDFDSPITFSLDCTNFNKIANCLVFRNLTTSQPQYLPVVHINYGHSNPLRLTRETASRFVTLRPSEPYVFKTSFRPWGDVIFDEQHWSTMSLKERAKYALSMGIHTLKIGDSYEIGVLDGLIIPVWMVGDKEDLIALHSRDPGVWRSTPGRDIQIVSAPPVRFVVEA